MNGQGLGGVGFSGSIGQPGAVGMGPGAMGGGGMGLQQPMYEQILYGLLASNPQLFGMPRGGGGVPAALIQNAISRMQAELVPGAQAAPAAAALAPVQRPTPTLPPMYSPAIPSSPYGGLLSQQGSGGYSGLLSRMMSSPNRMGGFSR